MQILAIVVSLAITAVAVALFARTVYIADAEKGFVRNSVPSFFATE